MESPAAIAAAHALKDALPGVYGTRYVSVAGLVVLLWDHCLTFEQERRLIWPSPTSYVKLAFLANRYVVPLVIVVQTHTLSGISTAGLSDDVCKASFLTSFLLGTASIALANSLILTKVWKLWGKNSAVVFISSVMFVITQLGAVVFVAASIADVWQSLLFTPALRMCTLNTKPHLLRFAWVLTIVFDVFLFLMVCANALSRPRESHTLLMKVLYRDGIGFFVAVTALRVMNLILSVVAPASEILLGIYFIWALVATIVSRMMMNSQEAELAMKWTDDDRIALHILV